MNDLVADRYELQQELGRGGMGVVFRAVDRSLQRPVALKRLTAGLAEDASFRIRFEREARALARVRHPNVVTIHDLGDDGGVPWFAMDLCRDGSLGDALAGGPLEATEVRQIAVAVADALTALATVGLVHRDLKPENILRDGDRWLLSDFGIVRDEGADGTALTESGMLIGTPEYWAPEYLADGRPTGAADLYSLGCVLYRALTGEPPYRAENRLRVAMMHVSEPPPEVPEAVRATDPTLAVLIGDLLRKDPAARPTAAAVLSRLGRTAHATTLVELPAAAAVEAADAIAPPTPPIQAPPPTPVAPGAPAPAPAPSSAPPDPAAAATVLTPATTARRRRRTAWFGALGGGAAALLVAGAAVLLLGEGDAPPGGQPTTATPRASPPDGERLAEPAAGPARSQRPAAAPRFRTAALAAHTLLLPDSGGVAGQRCFGPGGRASLTINGATHRAAIIQCGQRSEDAPNASGIHRFQELPDDWRVLGFTAQVGIDQRSARSQVTSFAEFVVTYGPHELCRVVVSGGRSGWCRSGARDIAALDGTLMIEQVVRPNTTTTGQGVWAGLAEPTLRVRQPRA